MNTFVVEVTGRPSPSKFASEPEPRSKKKRSRCSLPTSINTDAEAWHLLTNGSPLPRIVTRTSSGASCSAPGWSTSALVTPGVPTTGVVVSGVVLPS